MKRNFIAGIVIGAAVVGAPLAYIVRGADAFEVDSAKSSVAIPPVLAADGKPAPSAMDDYLYKGDDTVAQTGVMYTDFGLKGLGETEIDWSLTKAAPLPKPTATPSHDELKTAIREAVKSDPSIVIDAVVANPKPVIDALNAYMQQQQSDAEKNRDQQTLSFADKLTASEGYPVIGDKDAPVEIAYYFDVNCHYCKDLEPKLTQFVKDFPDAKIVMREFPILADSSRYAAEISGLLWEIDPDKYEPFHHDLMTLPPGMSNDDINASLRNIAGADTALRIIALANDPKTDPVAQKVANAVATTMKTATDAGVTGTPFVMVKDSGIFLRGAAKDAYAQLQSMAQIARANHAVTATKPAN
jgi:protein-disulfide isomerase